MIQILHCLHFVRLVKIEHDECPLVWNYWDLHDATPLGYGRSADSVRTGSLSASWTKMRRIEEPGVLRFAWSLIKCIRFSSDFGLNARMVFLEASSAWGDFETFYPECFRNFVTFLLIVLLFVDRTVPFRGVITTPESPYDSKLMLRGLYGIGCCSALPWFSSRFCLDNSVHKDTHLSIYYRLWRQEDRFCLSWGSHGLSFAQVSSCAQRLFGIWSFIKRMDECLWLNSAPNHCDQRTANPLSISFQ